MARTFQSAREALGHAAASLARPRLRRQSTVHGGAPPDDWTAVAVLAVMREAGCPWDSPRGQAALAWATAPDDVGEHLDSATRSALAALLETHGLVRPLRKMVVGYRVHEIDGRHVIACVIDPDPNDASVIIGPRATVIAAALAAGLVVQAEQRTKQTWEDARAMAFEMADSGASMVEVDVRVAQMMGVTQRTARWRRQQRWGLLGQAGRKASGG